MDSQVTPSSKIPAIRTYAKDLEMKRKEKGLPAETLSTPVPAAAPTPKAAPAVEFKNTPRVHLFKRSKKTEDKPAAAPTPLPPLSSIPKKSPVPQVVAEAVTSEPSFIVDNEDAASATIITDTKRDRFKLFPAIIASIKSWFVSKKKSYAAKKVPKYTVPETTRRKGVIQKATSKTGKFTTSDFESIQDRIRQRKEAEEKPEATTTWTANTEPGFPLLTGEVAEPKITNVQVVARKSFRAPQPPTAPATPAPVITITKKAPEVPKPVPEPEAVVEPVVEEPVETEPTESPVVATEPSRQFSLLSIRTNLLALGFSGLVIAVIVVGFYGYFVVSPEETITPALATPSTYFTDSSLRIIPLTIIDGQSITEALANERDGNTAQSELVFTHSTNQTPVPAPLLFAGMKLSVPRDFAQAIADVRFGYVGGNPYLYLHIKDAAAARGGMLTWENNLYTAFRGIFVSTLMPEESVSTFVDGSLSGNDVRVLTHSNGQELLLYSLVEGGVIITTGSAPLATLLNQ